MKNKKNNKKRSRPLIGLLAILVSLSVGIVLSSENTQTAVTAQPAVKPGFWSNLKEKAADKYKQVKNYVEQNAEIQAAKKKGEEFFNQAKTELGELAEKAKTGASSLWTNKIVPTITKAKQEITEAVGGHVSQATKNIVQSATTSVNNLVVTSVQGIEQVTNSILNWINKNLSPEKAQAAIAQIQQQAAVATQGVIDKGQQAMTETATGVANAAQQAAQSLQPGEPMNAPVG